MRILGIDFTSAPTARKPITVARGRLEGKTLRIVGVERLATFAAFEALLLEPGPWVGGFDFPFAQTRRLVDDLGWPADWPSCVREVARLGPEGFARMIKAYEAARPAGAKQPRRAIDRATGGQPPQKVQWQPVGLMFARGAPRLLASGVHIPLLHPTGTDRVALEVYPGVMARALIGRASYKSEDGDAPFRRRQRERLVAALGGAPVRDVYGLDIRLDAAGLVEDPKGDVLDAVLCAVQAAWAARQPGWGIPPAADAREGWICDPHLCEALAA